MTTVAERSAAGRKAARTRAKIAALNPAKPTRQEGRLLTFIIKFRVARGHSPTQLMMMGFLGYRSQGALARLLDGLERKGHIDRGPVPVAQMRIFSHSRETDVPKGRPSGLGERYLFSREAARAS